MDITRFSLYSALAVITYLLLLAWQEDYPPIVNDGGISSELGGLSDVGSTPFIEQTTASSDIPAQVPNTPSSSSDNGSLQNSQTQPLIQEVTGQEFSIVTVRTDTLELVIDLNGGDIVTLALPLYLKQLNVPDDPFILLEQSRARSYVAQSGLIGRDGIDAPNRARYKTSSPNFQMGESDDSLSVDLLTTTDTGVQIVKRYTFNRGSYLIDVSFIVNNPTNSDFRANAFGQIKRDAFDDPSSSGGFGRTYLGYVSTNEEDPYIEIDFDDIDDGANSFETMGGWIGFSQHYFISAWVPDSNTVNRYTTRKNNLNQYFGEFTGSAFDVPATGSASYQMQFYAGPKDQYVLADISPNLDLTIDYSFLWFLAAPIYWLLRQLDSLIGNYGLSIIVLTIIVKGAFYKLSETQYKSMAGMRRLMPKMQQLKESYGDDRMKLQQATMELYKKEKINPFGGCLPMLVQMPVFIALYWVLLESVELRHAPFILWLQDLSVRDPFFILPLLMGATMYLQTTLSPAPADPMQAKVMKLMPIMMTVLFLWFPAGLVLYWLTNGLLGILQQWYITRKIEAAYEAKAAK
ncbi:MAG: membrane protein insertase YidC [Proteobacteria bacterium]|nr:membrane protein insertase YidC [Pseudomonadota bacterium]MDA0928185.1 membrane protein insertase YidC [Pseudomonadota bacterium]